MTQMTRTIIIILFLLGFYHFLVRRKIIKETILFVFGLIPSFFILMWEGVRLETRLLIVSGIFLIVHLILKFLTVEPKEESKKQSYLEIREWAETIFSSLLIALFVMQFLIQAYKIPSRSMVPTFLVGDHLFAIKFPFGIRDPFKQGFLVKWKKPQRGEIIIFRYPLDTRKDFVKRVIGLPGEKLEIRDKVVYINDEKLEEPYVQHTDPNVYPKEVSNRDNFGPIIIPEGCYFVMGDNRDESLDSRFWGPLEEKYIVGKPGLLFFPFSRAKIIKGFYNYK